MSKSHSIAAARNHLPALVHDAEEGRHIELTRRGKPVAMLVSIADYQRLSSARPDLWTFITGWRARTNLAALNLDDVFNDVRDPSPGPTGDVW